MVPAAVVVEAGGMGVKSLRLFALDPPGAPFPRLSSISNQEFQTLRRIDTLAETKPPKDYTAEAAALWRAVVGAYALEAFRLHQLDVACRAVMRQREAQAALATERLDNRPHRASETAGHLAGGKRLEGIEAWMIDARRSSSGSWPS